jgi:hypothetical protein
VKLGDRDERFNSRFQQFPVKPPEHNSIAALLKRFGLAATMMGTGRYATDLMREIR